MTSTAEDEREKSNVGPNASKKTTPPSDFRVSSDVRSNAAVVVALRKLLGLKITVFVVLLLRSEMSPSFPIMALSSKIRVRRSLAHSWKYCPAARDTKRKQLA